VVPFWRCVLRPSAPSGAGRQRPSFVRRGLLPHPPLPRARRPALTIVGTHLAAALGPASAIVSHARQPRRCRCRCRLRWWRHFMASNQKIYYYCSELGLAGLGQPERRGKTKKNERSARAGGVPSRHPNMACSDWLSLHASVRLLLIPRPPAPMVPLMRRSVRYSHRVWPLDLSCFLCFSSLPRGTTKLKTAAAGKSDQAKL